MLIDRLEEYVVREQVMKLLSAEEVATVSERAGCARLREGQEYLDLEQATQGVKRATETAPPEGRVLPRDAVHASTWGKILDLVAGSTHETPR